MQKIDSRRNHSLDWMRVICILYLVGFWHLLNYTNVWPDYHHPVFWRVTVASLALFTLISGYLIGQGEAPTNLVSLKRFYVKRLIRIYPPYFLALLLYLLFELASRFALLKGVLLVGLILPPPAPTLWFVGMIALFYVITPLLIAISTSALKMSTCLGVTALLLWLVSLNSSLIDERLPLYLPAYAAGIWFARQDQPRMTIFSWSILASLIALATFLTAWAEPRLDQSVWMAPYAMLSSIGIFLAANHRFGHNPIVAWLSYGSFFLYLIHRPIYHLAINTTRIPDGQERFLLLVGVAFPIAIILAFLGQKLYDKVVNAVLTQFTTKI